MNWPRDSQRSRCYRAERAGVARCPDRPVASLERAQQFIDEVVASEWWAEHADYDGRVVVHEWPRSRKPAASPFLAERRGRENVYRKQPNIALPQRSTSSWAWCEWVLLHELAHIGRLSWSGMRRLDEPAHSAAWAGLFLALVREFIGEEAGEVLVEEFKTHRVRHRLEERTHPAVADWPVAS